MLDDMARQQNGVITRVQALAGGLTKAKVQANLKAGRWQRIFVGVYATFSGPVPRGCLLWAVALRAGGGAMLSHETAAELVGLTDRPAAAIHVTVPARRTIGRMPGVVVHRSGRAHVSRHPARTPPQTRIEETVIDLTQTARGAEAAIGWVARAVGARLTTTARLLDAMRKRPKLRWRRLLLAALRDVAEGCHSIIEVIYSREVERAHGLPTGARQVRVARAGRSRYDDVRYRRYRTRVELDGRAAHPDHERWRDYRRDNEAVVDGDRVLRYGLGDVSEHPCHVAAQVGGVLIEQGWTGRPRRCRRADCVIS